jgi:predicted Zn-dependent protease with MMP-like domain
MNEEDFKEAVSKAIDQVPEEFMRYLKNVAILVEDEPGPDLLHEQEMDQNDDLLGIYQGVPVQDKSVFEPIHVNPDTIIIYRGPHLRICKSKSEIIREITTTVLHEIAHHFGFDEQRLEELGY